MDSAHVGEMAQIRVVLADDHPIVRSGIRGLLEREPDIAVVAETRDGVAALRLARDLTPDVLLLDLELPELSGVEVARRIRQDGSAARVLVLSAHDDEAHILGLLAHGAAGYLTKAEAPGRIVAVRGVARGDGLVQPERRGDGRAGGPGEGAVNAGRHALHADRASGKC